MSPITDYNLGRAHGRIVVDYDSKGTDQAQEEFEAVEEAAGSLESAFEKLRKFFNFFTHDFQGNARKFATMFGVLSGGAAILLGMSRATGTLNGSIFKLRGGISIIRSLSFALGGLPASVQGFPKIIKQIIQLSAVITLVAKSSHLLDGVVRQIAKFVGSTKIIQALTNAFPGLAAAIRKAISFIPSIKTMGDAINNLGKPIHQIARMALSIGTLISLFKGGTKLAYQLTKGILILGASGAALQALIFVVAGLVDGMLELSGLVGLLPGLLAATKLSIATFVVGLTGVQDAMKKLNAEQAEFEEAIKDMAPAAQEFMRTLRGLRDEWKDLTQSVQQQLFAGTAEQVNRLATIYIPLLKRQMSLLAVDFNFAGKEFANFAARGETVAGINRLFEMTRLIVQRLTKAIQPLLQAFLDIAIVSSEALADITRDAGGAAQAFANFIRNARETGQLREWIENGITGLARLVDIVYNLGASFKIIFDAFDTGGDGFLLTLDKLTDQMLAFLQSAKGQEALKTVVELINILSSATHAVLAAGFKELIPLIATLLPLIEVLAQTISAVLVSAIGIVGPMLRGIAAALSFMAPVLGPVIGFFLAFGIAAKVLGLGLVLVFGSIFKLIGVISIFMDVMGGLAKLATKHPILFLIAALATAAILLIQNWEKVAPVLKAVWDWISSTAISIWTAIVDFFTGIWDAVTGYFIGIWEDIKNTSSRIWNAISDFFVGIWEDVTGFFIDIWEKTSKAVVDIWNWIVDTFRPIWEPIADIIGSIISIIRDLLIIVFGSIAIGFIALWNLIRDAIIDAWTTITEWLTVAWQGIVAFWHSIWDPAVQWFTDLWNLVSTTIQNVWNTIVQWLTDKWNQALAVWHEIFDPWIELFQNIWNGIKEGIENTWNAITTWLSDQFNRIRSMFSDSWNAIGNFFRDIWDSKIVRAVRDGVSAVVDWIRGLPGKIWDLVKDAGRWLWDAGKAVITGFLDGLKNAFSAVADWVGGIKDWIVAHKGPLPVDRKILIPAGQAIMEGLLSGLQSKQQVIQGFLLSLTDDIANGLNGANAMLTDTAGTIASSATVGILTNLSSNENVVASSPTPVSAPANGGSAPTDRAGEPSPAPIVIQQLDLHVAGNLDPTKPVEWRNAMKHIKDGIRDVDRESK